MTTMPIYKLILIFYSYSQENIPKLFLNIIQFSAGTLQNGGESGMGLWSTYIYYCCGLVGSLMLFFTVSKSIMDLHKGKISVYSAGEGQGCTFTMDIPFKSSSVQLEAKSDALEPRLSIKAGQHAIDRSHSDKILRKELKGPDDVSSASLSGRLELGISDKSGQFCRPRPLSEKHLWGESKGSCPPKARTLFEFDKELDSFVVKEKEDEQDDEKSDESSSDGISLKSSDR